MNEGFDNLLIRLSELVKSIDDVKLYDDSEFMHVLYKYEKETPYTITNDNGIWVISGKEVEKAFSMTRFTEDESVARFGRILKAMGIEDSLLEMGAKRGDEVQILDYIFEFKD